MRNTSLRAIHNTANPCIYESTLLRARLKLVLILRVLRLISNNRGSYLKGA